AVHDVDQARHPADLRLGGLDSAPPSVLLVGDSERIRRTELPLLAQLTGRRVGASPRLERERAERVAIIVERHREREVREKTVTRLRQAPQFGARTAEAELARVVHRQRLAVCRNSTDSRPNVRLQQRRSGYGCVADEAVKRLE